MTRPTLVSLANELGVSRQTVSNVINAPHLVRPETRERVQKAITESGYRPNVAAQALRNQRSRTIGMRILPASDGINGAIMDRFLHHLVAECQELGYNLMLFTATDERDEVAQARELFERGSIDGAVLTGTHADDRRPAELAELGIPCAAFGRPWGKVEQADHIWVDVDGRAGTRAATRHLLSLGHTRIGFIGWPRGSESGDDRRAGWSEAMTEAGIEGWEQWQADGEDGTPTGLVSMQRLEELGVEGVVCASDSLALGAREAIRRRCTESHFGELPVIGFDNTPVAAAITMSSIAQPVERCAQLLASALVHDLDPKSRGRALQPDERLVVPVLAPRSIELPPVR
ncbi:LacI family DNA-binding transcriptional regulator [Luteococcus sanguinis]|uniref:LacI family DNA-binding transcriptional regulator n=1 Tax=Luteococcus sanguinis TaxID=174038 RepID=A0ABW1X1D2_9ACTN